jgi:hypothetical protein
MTQDPKEERKPLRDEERAADGGDAGEGELFSPEEIKQNLDKLLGDDPVVMDLTDAYAEYARRREEEDAGEPTWRRLWAWIKQ